MKQDLHLNVEVHYSINKKGTASVTDRKKFINHSGGDINVANSLVQNIKPESTDPIVTDLNGQNIEVKRESPTTYSILYKEGDSYTIPKKGQRGFIIEYKTENFLRKIILQDGVSIECATLNYRKPEVISNYINIFSVCIQISCETYLRGLKSILYDEKVYLINNDTNVIKEAEMVSDSKVGILELKTETQNISDRGSFCVYRVTSGNKAKDLAIKIGLVFVSVIASAVATSFFS